VCVYVYVCVLYWSLTYRPLSRLMVDSVTHKLEEQQIENAALRARIATLTYKKEKLGEEGRHKDKAIENFAKYVLK